jgi:hypothetical protein
MKLLSVSDYFYIFNEIYQKFHSFRINVMKIYTKFEWTQPIFEKFQKVHRRFYVNERNYTQFMMDFFWINEFLSKLMTIYILYEEHLSIIHWC